MAKKFTIIDKKDTRSGFGAGLLELGRMNPDVVALCADLGGSLKMDAFAKEFPDPLYTGWSSRGQHDGHCSRTYHWRKNSFHRNICKFFYRQSV
jgi:hypothetical protein